MSSQHPGQDEQDHFGRLDDAAEDAEPSSTQDGPAAAGEYDPAQGSPGTPHPKPREGFSEEITHYDTTAADTEATD